MYRYLAVGFFAICLEAVAFTGRLSGLDCCIFSFLLHSSVHGSNLYARYYF